MLCDNCHFREASVSVKLTRNGQTKNLSLCSECAGKVTGKGVLPSIFETFLPAEWQDKDSLAESFFGWPQTVTQTKIKPKVCPQCGQSLADFKATGLLGCGTCYEVFRGEVESVLERVQRNTIHTGHRPGKNTADTGGEAAGGEGSAAGTGVGQDTRQSISTADSAAPPAPVLSAEEIAVSQDLTVLQINLKKAIENEDYEKAVLLRDRIRALGDEKADISAKTDDGEEE